MTTCSFVATLTAAFSILVFPASGDTEYKVRGLAVQAGVPATEVHAHAADGSITAGPIQVKSYLNHEFETLTLKSPKLVFTAKPDPASAKDPAEVIGSCELSTKGGTAILLFIQEVPDKPACRVIVLDDSEKAMPKGSVLIANFTSMPARIELEKQPFELKAGEIKVIKDQPVGATNSSGMKGTYEHAGKWHTFSSGLWPHPGDKRVLQIITEAPGQQVEIRGVADVSKS